MTFFFENMVILHVQLKGTILSFHTPSNLVGGGAEIGDDACQVNWNDE